MTAPETQSPLDLDRLEAISMEGAAPAASKLNAMEWLGRWMDALSPEVSAWRRLLSERDSLAARVSHLEARLERAGQRVIDAIPRQCTNEPDMHGDWCRNLGHAAPVPEDKKESAP